MRGLLTSRDGQGAAPARVPRASMSGGLAWHGSIAEMNQLGKYRIVRELGRGAMGVVYEGYDSAIERRVAIKVVRAEELDGAELPCLLLRLRREAQAAGRLNHPGIVTVFDYGEDLLTPGHPVAFIAMELVDGRDLKKLLDEGRHFDLGESTRLVSSVLEALKHAHDRGVVHRDIKPANIMLLPGGAIKVADFGVARLDNSELTREGTVIGSPQYMSPEQLMGLAVDSRSDLYSCGVLLYQLLTGGRPFTGSYATVIQKVLNEEPVPPSAANASLDPAWDALLRRAMAKTADARFQTATEFAAALVRVAEASAAGGPEATVMLSAQVAPVARATDSSARDMAGQSSTRTADVRVLPDAIEDEVSEQREAEAVRPRHAEALDMPLVGSNRARLVVGGLLACGAMLSGYLLVRSSAGLQQASVVSHRAAPPVDASRVAASQPAPLERVALASGYSSPEAPPPLERDWAARIAALESSPPPDLQSGLAELLDADRHQRASLEKLAVALGQSGRSAAMAMGVANGNIKFFLRVRPFGVEAQGLAARECNAAVATPCELVFADGRFQPAAFAAMARTLGSRPVAEVRLDLMRSVEQALAESRVRANAGAAAAEWAQARAALTALDGGATLVSALTTLLSVHRSDEFAAIAGLQDAVRRLRWKSALALGENNGALVLGNSSNEASVAFANDAALEACSRTTTTPCVVVMTDGQFNPAAFRQLSLRLGARPQAETRQDFLDTLRRAELR
jgi:serine/threonine protein kinase